MDAVVVVPGQVVLEPGEKVLDAGKALRVVELGFEVAEEVLGQ